VNSLTASAFDLPDYLTPKAAPSLMRKARGGIRQEAMDGDMEVHRLMARLTSS
jgi:hypothetical protein